MKSLIVVLAIAVSLSLQAAETAYITDRAQVFLRSGESTKFKIIRTLFTGTQLTVLKRNPSTGYSKVRLEDGKVGWLLTRFLIEHPGAASQLEQATNELAAIREENKRLKEEVAALRTAGSKTASDQESTARENAQMSRELNTIRHAAAHAIQIKNERDLLQERVVNLERETKKLQRDNQALEDSRDQDWFVAGAAVLFGGILLGLVLPKLSWRRKTRNWDTF